MAGLTDYVSAISVGGSVTEITGKSRDGFTAGGFAAFVQAITGAAPTVVPMPDRKAKVVLTDKQVVIMRQWLDRQLVGALAKKPDETLTLDMNPVIVPWALKYIVPTALLFVLVGWLGHYYFTR